MEDLGIFHIVGQPNLNIKIDRAKAARYGLNTGDVNTVVQAAMAGAVATTVLESDRQFNLTVRLAPTYRDSIEKIGNIPVGYQTRERRDRLHSAARARRTSASDSGRILHLPRGHAALHSDQVQRPRPRSRQHGGRGPGANCEEHSSADGISHPMGGRVPGSADRQEAAGSVRADESGADPGPALQPVQFSARQSAGPRRNTLCGRRRRARAVRRPGCPSASRRPSGSSPCLVSR